MKKIDFEGTRRLQTVFQPHENRMYVQQDSHQYEGLLAGLNARMRAMGQTGKGNVRLHLQMSEQEYNQLLAKYPILATGTTEQRRRAWERVAKKRPELVAMEFQPRVFGRAG